MLNKGSKFFKNEEFIDIHNKKWTEKVDERLYLIVNLNAKEIYRRIDKIAERLNIEVEIN